MPDVTSPAFRAKQFMPFAALRGYYELVERAARPRDEKRDLLADRLAELDDALSEIAAGDRVSVVHHDGERYVATTGVLDEASERRRTVTVSGREIALSDVVDIGRV